jgi:hypothetical protein
MLKYVRIAATALSLTACVLLVALWVRCYWWRDLSAPLLISRIPTSIHQGKVVYVETQKRSTADMPDPLVNGYLPPWISFSYKGFTVRGTGVAVPVWALIPPMAAIAALPWIRWRFSVRTLLIATTLVAVVLGIVVAAS